MFGKPWALIKEGVTSFINDEALTRGAAIAFYGNPGAISILTCVVVGPDFTSVIVPGI